MAPVRFTDIPPGYPRHAALTSRDKVYAVYRKFLALNSRNLLYLQSEIMDLESQLKKTDRELFEDESQKRLGFPALKSWAEFAQNEARTEMFEKIRCKLETYSMRLPGPM
jgi:hypothetical protein